MEPEDEDKDDGSVYLIEHPAMNKRAVLMNIFSVLMVLVIVIILATRCNTLYFRTG